MNLTIVTNHVPRYTIPGYDLTAEERARFDYMDNVDEGTFIRYRGELYDIGEFMATSSELSDWHGYHSDSYFSGTVIKFVDDSSERVIVGRYYS